MSPSDLQTESPEADSAIESEATEREGSTDGASDDDEHLSSLDDGAGCTEIWEHLSERREE